MKSLEEQENLENQENIEETYQNLKVKIDTIIEEDQENPNQMSETINMEAKFENKSLLGQNL